MAVLIAPLFVELARLLEHHQALAMEELAREAIAIAGGFMSFDKVGSPLNKAVGVGLDAEIDDAALDAIEAFFTARGVEPRIELTAFASRSLLARLALRGFTLREIDNVLVRDLAPDESFASILGRALPEGVTVARIDPSNAEEVYDFADASGSGFGPEGQPTSAEMIDLASRTTRLPMYDCFIARRNGVAIGGGTCNSRDGVTALFGASVRSAHRNLGVQQALIAARLVAAISRGSTLANIVSRPGIPTERNAARLGFRMSYARVALAKAGPGLATSV